MISELNTNAEIVLRFRQEVQRPQKCNITTEGEFLMQIK